MDEKLCKEMNDQVTKELFSAYLYLSMAAYFENKGLSGMAHWMKIQSQEEMFHGMKIFDYLNERGEKVVLEAFEKPQSEFKSVRDVFEGSLAHEKKITVSCNNIYSIALEVKDHAAVGFMQWFVDEQVEEEANANEILTKFNFIKEDSVGMLMLDKELSARPQPTFAAAGGVA